ncbi:5,6-dimethylbenzimidazole synthase [Thermoflavimicrobium dichotomicum]|uniref:5,6-dimethylbenzimidazole synthase n=1 Tax=Thermoflavimicrobium dichotomicum TaxID=46223 RepID=A0A1I3QWY9_9BACL|nr:5,6-dimethylbenzimidazole synthase [Thermoflavimicrobium dichotomicum]SFJ37992.1 5,6-dimethylbenzimidazole synthase [Thermoflavimicrobium dichotomicum]
MSDTFSKQEQEVIYRLIRARRDIRHFASDPVPEDALQRILEAAHYAPSVGFMQPWNFILITSQEIKQKIKASFEETNREQLQVLSEDERKELYRKLKLEGIMEAPINIAVTCDRNRDAPFVLGRSPMPETDLYSTCLAIQNMWLAARAEGIGIGWVSLINQQEVKQILRLPAGVELVAYLCIGYPTQFPKKPMLEELGWKSRLPLKTLVYENQWGQLKTF